MPDGSSVTRQDATKQSLAQLAAGSPEQPSHRAKGRIALSCSCSGTQVSSGLWPGEVETPGLTSPTHPTLGHNLEPQGHLELPGDLQQPGASRKAHTHLQQQLPCVAMYSWRVTAFNLLIKMRILGNYF